MIHSNESLLLRPVSPPEANYTLVVVDMQPGFEASKLSRLQPVIEREIREARAHSRPILVLECHLRNRVDFYGKTYAWLMRCLLEPNAYGRHAVVYKFKDNGSSEVIDACSKLGFDSTAFRVCGVNTDACIARTVQGLADKLPACRVAVVREACNTDSPDDGLMCLPERENIEVCSSF